MPITENRKITNLPKLALKSSLKVEMEIGNSSGFRVILVLTGLEQIIILIFIHKNSELVPWTSKLFFSTVTLCREIPDLCILNIENC